MPITFLDPNTGEPVQKKVEASSITFLDPNTGEPLAKAKETPARSYTPDVPAGPLGNAPGWLLDAIKEAGKGALLTGYNVVTGGGKIIRKLTPYPDLTPEQQAEQKKVRSSLAASEDTGVPGHVAHAVGGMAPYFIPGVGTVGGAAAMGAEAYGATDSPVDAALAAGTGLVMGKLIKKGPGLKTEAENYVNRAIVRDDAAAARKIAQDVAASEYVANKNITEVANRAAQKAESDALARGASPAEAREAATEAFDSFKAAQTSLGPLMASGAKQIEQQAGAAGAKSADPLKEIVQQQLLHRAVGGGIGALTGWRSGGLEGAGIGLVAGSITPALAQKVIANNPAAANMVIRAADGSLVKLGMIAASRVPAELASTQDEPLRRPSSLHGGSTF